MIRKNRPGNQGSQQRVQPQQTRQGQAARAPDGSPQPKRPTASGTSAPGPAAPTPHNPLVPQKRMPAARRIEADEKTIREILNYQGEVLTAEGGKVPTTEAQRLVVAALDNGVLLVSRSQPMSTEVASVRNLLRTQNIVCNREYLVELEHIRRVYEAADRRSTGGTSKRAPTEAMQQEFLNLVSSAAEVKSSDIHIYVHRYEAIIKVRQNGVLMRIADLAAAKAQQLLSAAYNMADESDSNYKPLEYQAARIANTNGKLPEGVQAVRLQFNPLANGGRYLVARLLYAQEVADDSDIDDLGYARSHIKQIKRMRQKPQGINIISGPTGSGKSTTLQRALTALMREKPGKNVVTIEDPPEFIIENAAQMPITNVKTDADRSEAFRKAITASLRSDPDIIMIGEIRDKSSSKLAFEAATTGHQVWGSLHANNAISILDRFRNQEVDMQDLCDPTLVTGLIGQRLIRKLCPHCKLPLSERTDAHNIDVDMLESVHELAADYLEEIRIPNLKGCEHCRGGYAGREVIAECIVPDHEFMQYIKEGKKKSALEYWLSDLDGMTMLEHAYQKLITGTVDPQEFLEIVGPLSEIDAKRIPKVIEYMS